MASSNAEIANPQMPQISPVRQDEDIRKVKDIGSLGIRAGMPSWDDLRGNPHFKVGIIIESSSTKDLHVPSIAKPATPCTLSSVVVLYPGKGEDKEVSMMEWLGRHQMQAVAPSVVVGWGQEGLEDLLADAEVDAVYIIVRPG